MIFKNHTETLFEKWLAILLLLILVSAITPEKIIKRVVQISKTPTVLATSEDSVYAELYYKKYLRLMDIASQEYNVPVPLIAAVIKAESDFNPFAVSRTGAKGLMQIMPATWLDLGGTGSPYNIGMNIMMGTKYLRQLMDQFDGNLHLTLAAYNAGPGAVQKYKRVPPYGETRQYVPRVLGYYQRFLKTLRIG